jgi:hypothetical protein
MRKGLALFVGTVMAGAALILAHAWTGGAPVQPVSLNLLAFWVVLSLAAECFWLETPTGKGMVSTALAINLAMLFVLPRPYVLAIGALTVGASDLLVHQRKPLKASFNAAQTTIALAVCFEVARLLGMPVVHTNMDSLLHHPGATLAVPVTFFVINTFVVAGAISLDTRRTFWSTWKANYGFGYQVLSCGVLFLLGLTFVEAYDRLGYIVGLFYLVFFYFVRDSYHRYVRERRARSWSI